MSTDGDPDLSSLKSGRLGIFERYKEEYATYGFAISHFSMFEQGLLALFIRLDEKPTDQAISAYWSINSCRSRFEWIQKQIRKRDQSDRLVQAWNTIQKRTSDAIEARNELAHGEFTPIMVSNNREIVGLWVRLAKMASTGQLSFDQETKTIAGVACYPAGVLIEMGLEFIELSEELFAIAEQPATPTPAETQNTGPAGS